MGGFLGVAYLTTYGSEGHENSGFMHLQSIVWSSLSSGFFATALPPRRQSAKRAPRRWLSRGFPRWSAPALLALLQAKRFVKERHIIEADDERQFSTAFLPYSIRDDALTGCELAA